MLLKFSPLMWLPMLIAYKSNDFARLSFYPSNKLMIPPIAATTTNHQGCFCFYSNFWFGTFVFRRKLLLWIWVKRTINSKTKIIFLTLGHLKHVFWIKV